MNPDKELLAFCLPFILRIGVIILPHALFVLLTRAAVNLMPSRSLHDCSPKYFRDGTQVTWSFLAIFDPSPHRGLTWFYKEPPLTDHVVYVPSLSIIPLIAERNFFELRYRYSRKNQDSLTRSSSYGRRTYPWAYKKKNLDSSEIAPDILEL